MRKEENYFLKQYFSVCNQLQKNELEENLELYYLNKEHDIIRNLQNSKEKAKQKAIKNFFDVHILVF
ncbi:hypothetical protein [Candidatus Phytoplasma fraxini]|uniref:hypothetical protein n=1 Tax=Ash yellows phytoplasma TaxID=35780 RepID=UPI0030FF0C93